MGQVMRYFYKALYRRRGEDMTLWVVRFGDARSQMAEEYCVFAPGISGWWLIAKTGLGDGQFTM